MKPRLTGDRQGVKDVRQAGNGSEQGVLQGVVLGNSRQPLKVTMDNLCLARKFTYRQIHPGFCGSRYVWGPVIHHIPSLAPPVPIVPMGTQRLVCDGPTMAACVRLLGLNIELLGAIILT